MFTIWLSQFVKDILDFSRIATGKWFSINEITSSTILPEAVAYYSKLQIISIQFPSKNRCYKLSNDTKFTQIGHREGLQRLSQRLVVEMTKKWKNQVGGSQELELAGDLEALHSMMLREILYK